MFELVTLQDQLDLLTDSCTANDVASIWGSILVTWFPPVEGYQLRLHTTEDWTEVYILRIIRQLTQTRATISLVFTIRCYGRSTEAIPPMGPWRQTCREIMDSIVEFRDKTVARGFPAYGAIACLESVRLCEVFGDRHRMMACAGWPGLYTVNFNGPIPEFLNRVKGEIAKVWGHPYTYNGNSGDRNGNKRNCDVLVESDESEGVSTGGDLRHGLKRASKEKKDFFSNFDEDGYLGDMEKGVLTDDETEFKSEDRESAGVMVI